MTPPPLTLTRRKTAALVRYTALHFDLTPEMLLGPDRRRPVAYARHIAMYVAKERLHLSFQAIATAFQREDHTSAMYACERIGKELTNPAVVADIAALAERLEADPEIGRAPSSYTFSIAEVVTRTPIEAHDLQDGAPPVVGVRPDQAVALIFVNRGALPVCVRFSFDGLLLDRRTPAHLKMEGPLDRVLPTEQTTRTGWETRRPLVGASLAAAAVFDQGGLACVMALRLWTPERVEHALGLQPLTGEMVGFPASSLRFQAIPGERAVMPCNPEQTGRLCSGRANV